MCCRVGRVFLVVALALLAGATGCGSKVSEASYYKVLYGMSEDGVEEVLGPAHGESTLPGMSDVKLKTWTRGPLTIRVRFEDGKVVSRTLERTQHELGPSTAESARFSGGQNPS